MIDAALKALEQMLSRPFRAVLLKSAALALALLVAVGILADRSLSSLLDGVVRWLETAAGPHAHEPLNLLGWLLAAAAWVGIIAGAAFLIPVVTTMVATLFIDDIAREVERVYYPTDPPGQALPSVPAIMEGIKAALLSLGVYCCAVPLLILVGSGFVIFFLATAYIQGRIYFELAAMRFHSVADAKRLRRLHRGTVFMAGGFIAAFLAIPLVGLAAPLFGTAMMLHLYKRLAAGSRDF